MLIPDEIRKCVVFVSHFDGANYIAGGTAFFISYQAGNIDGSFVYLVTAKHVIVAAKEASKDNSVWLRFNQVEGSSVHIQCPIDAWQYHDDDTSVDAAILQWFDFNPQLEFLGFPHISAITSAMIAKEGIGVGSEGFLAGLFVNHTGKKRSLPIVRVRN